MSQKVEVLHEVEPRRVNEALRVLTYVGVQRHDGFVPSEFSPRVHAGSRATASSRIRPTMTASMAWLVLVFHTEPRDDEFDSPTNHEPRTTFLPRATRCPLLTVYFRSGDCGPLVT